MTVSSASRATLGTASPVATGTVLHVTAGSGATLTVTSGSWRQTVTVPPLTNSIGRLVNKRNGLPSNLAPALSVVETKFRLTPAAVSAYTAMRAGAAAVGYQLRISEAYRSYATQVAEYNDIKSRLGSTKADLLSARPGYSEHQLGLAVDVMRSDNYCTQMSCFGATRAGQWLAANSWRYGFILRYPSGYTFITGYSYEPWHFRYVGRPIAADMHRLGWHTYERYLGVPDAPTY